ncbi:MAG TPA: substrate-binding domain-containing protein [Fimbriimonadaceae bacterium]|nr:substrate-binding domain-containing protein [Fimbriimonadaceae bacterium]
MKRFLLFGLVVAVLFGGGCKVIEKESTTGGGSGAASSKKIVVAMLPKKKGVPYFTSCAEGAEEAAKELGNVELIYDGPTSGDAAEAAKMIDQWIAQGVDVIAVSPNDPAVLGPAMKRARDTGIHVITWDADAAPDTREFMVNQATAEEIGFALVDAMAKDLGGDSATGEVAIVTASLTAANQNEWMKHMKVRLEKYPGLKLVEVKPSNEDQKLAFSITQDLMKAYPNLKGVFAISSVAFPGAAEAIKQANKTGQVFVTGLSTPNDMRAYVKDDVVKSVILWNTKDLGYLTIQAARALVDGGLKKDSTLKAGRLNEKQVKGDNVLLGATITFTKENIDDFDF